MNKAWHKTQNYQDKDVRDGDHIIINAEVETEPDSMISIVVAPIDPDTTTIATIKTKSLFGSLLKLYFRGKELKDPQKQTKTQTKRTTKTKHSQDGEKTLDDYNIRSGDKLRGVVHKKKMAVDIPVPDSNVSGSEDSHKMLSRVW